MRGLKLFAAVCCFAMAAAAGEVRAATASDAEYDKLVAVLKSGDTDIDYAALREAYARSSHYDPYGQSPAATALVAAMKAHDCAKVVASANEVLDEDYTDIQAHVFAENCAGKLNDTTSAKFHHAVAIGLLRAIAGSGAGTNPGSPVVVNAVKEEYAFLLAQGFEVTRQSLVQCAKGPCDAMDVVDRQGAKTTLFFDVSRPMRWLNSKMGAQKKP